MENNMIHNATPEEIIMKAEAIVGENIELRRMVDEMRGRLRESRRATIYYHRRYEDALKYKADAEAEQARARARFRELAVAVAGAAVMATCLLFVAAACWGWHFG